MTLPEPESDSRGHGPSFAEVRRIYRRICLLRTNGDAAGADRLAAQELAPLVARLPAGESAARLPDLYAAEEERVADAFALASLLAPMLADRMALPFPVPPRPLAEVVPLPLPPPRRAGREARSGNIADFIDEMIATEDPARSPR